VGAPVDDPRGELWRRLAGYDASSTGAATIATPEAAERRVLLQEASDFEMLINKSTASTMDFCTQAL
jgi:hypothetical protein